jgi:hypothetical protein
MSYGSVFEESGSAGSDYYYFSDGYYGSERVTPIRSARRTAKPQAAAAPAAALAA